MCFRKKTFLVRTRVQSISFLRFLLCFLKALKNNSRKNKIASTAQLWVSDGFYNAFRRRTHGKCYKNKYFLGGVKQGRLFQKIVAVAAAARVSLKTTTAKPQREAKGQRVRAISRWIRAVLGKNAPNRNEKQKSNAPQWDQLHWDSSSRHNGDIRAILKAR